MARVVFMGTPEFAVPTLAALIEHEDVVGVVTQPDRESGRGRKLESSPVKVLAERHSIPILQAKSLRTSAAFEQLQAWAPEVIVVAAFGQVLRPNVLEQPRYGSLNVHASLLPRHRGSNPVAAAILDGDTVTG